MSDNSINQPEQASRTTPSIGGRLRAPIGSIAWSPLTSNTGVRNTGVRARRRTTTHTVVAPQRFDVHRLPDVASWLDQADELGSDNLTVDLSEVRFVDTAALAALDLLSRTPSVTVALVNPSAAYSLTTCLVGRGNGNASTTPADAGQSNRHSVAVVNLSQATSIEPLVIQVSGDLSVANADDFRRSAAELVKNDATNSVHKEHRPVVIDLSNVDHLDAAGLAGVTATLFEMRRSGRTVTVREPHRPEPAQFARLTGILPLLAA